ncbi:kinase-like protein [Atractiella rhizophila]|nr:kinase-like protein [Atractiella rhizophila]
MDSPLTSVATTTASSSRSSNATATPTTKRPKLKQTKTEILKEIASGNRDVSTPPILLKDKRKRFSSEKPDTPPASGEEAETELNGLDLESLNLLDKEISPDKLTKLEKIGSGGFKDVYKGRYKRYSVAIADIRGHLTEMDIKELSLLRDLRHDNIVRFIGVSIPEDPKDVPCMIVTELCSNGDLYDYIRNVNAPSLEKVLSIMLDIARGLEYLHTNTPSIIHRDLKSSNVLITAKGVGKINDFGLARVKNSTRSMVKSLVGTVNWQAPELWVPHPRYNEKVDVYSAGLVFWEMLQWHFPTKKYPFEGSNEHAIYNDVGKNKMRPSTKGMKPQWGSDILLLIDKMWAQEPSARPRMTEIVHTLEEQYLEARKKKR